MLKFNNQICTSAEQSKRLLDLGLNPETADMELIYNIFSNTYEPLPKAFPSANKCEIPAWSLHRLIEIVNLKIQFRLKEKTTVIYGISHSQPFQSFSGFGIDGKSYYNSVINAIEWLIKEGYFNKEYLKQ